MNYVCIYIYISHKPPYMYIYTHILKFAEKNFIEGAMPEKVLKYSLFQKS